MDNPVLIIEANKLNDESAASIQEFLHALMSAIDAHYYPQITRHYRNKTRCSYCEDVALF
jgi:hypothetical protein